MAGEKGTIEKKLNGYYKPIIGALWTVLVLVLGVLQYLIFGNLAEIKENQKWTMDKIINHESRLSKVEAVQEERK